MRPSADLTPPPASSPPAPRSASGLPWILAIGGVVGGAALIIAVSRLGGVPRGPLDALKVDPSPSASGRAAVSLQGFESQSVTRTGDRWQIRAAGLQADGDGLLLNRPVLELYRGSRAEVRLLARTGRVVGDDPRLDLSGEVVLRVGDDFLVRAESLALAPDGSVRGAGVVSVRTPRGTWSGSGILVEPAEGRVTLGAGTGDERVMRWTGWGRDLADLGEAYRNWSRTATLERDALLQAAER